MKLVLETRTTQRTAGGTKTYVEQLYQALCSHSSIEAVRIGGSPSVAWMPLWQNTILPARIRRAEPDVVHYTKAAIPFMRLAPTVVTIYDVIPILFPSSQRWLPRLLWPTTLKHAADHSDHVITISKQSKQDIVEKLNVSQHKITVTPLAIDHTHFYPRPPQPAANPYIIFVGTLEPRKNVPLLIRAFNRVAADIPHELLIVGQPSTDLGTIKQAQAASPFSSRISIRHDVTYEELPHLYTNADLGVWPSIYEGWGFPPEECLACGTSVVVSDGGSLPEVVGSAGTVIPFSQSHLSDRLYDDDFEQKLSQAMARQVGVPSDAAATGRTWQSVAEATIAVYNKVQAL